MSGQLGEDYINCLHVVAVIDCLHYHGMKKKKLKTIQWIKSRNCDPIGNKEKISPSFRSVHFPKLQIFSKV